jgi:hypothetical protein
MQSTPASRGIVRLAIVAALAALIAGQPALAQEPESLAKMISYEGAEIWPDDGRAPAKPLESAYYAAPASRDAGVETASSTCPTCNAVTGGYPYNRCGCSSYALFPWFTGPGRCDTWCVGPHWQVAVDGLILAREGVDFGVIPPGAGFVQTLAQDFEVAPGARVSVTGYNENRFGMQVAYEGVNDFHANALYANGAISRAITYESNLNSLEVNFIRRTDIAWRPFAGVRYVELDDDFVDFTTVPKPVPAPADPPVAAAFVDTGSAVFLDNRMIGLQAGAFRDVWRLNRWVTVEPFGNAGVYLNDFKRENVTRTVTTVYNGDDISTPGNEFVQTVSEVQNVSIQEITETAFVGEAGITGILRLNRCVALRAGYQVLAINGVGRGIDAFLAPGLDPATLVYHGGHFGVEYVR